MSTTEELVKKIVVDHLGIDESKVTADSKFIDHLEGNPRYVDGVPKPTTAPVINDRYITKLMRYLYSLNSQVSNHFTEEHVDRYTFKFLLNGLLAVFLWYGEWVKKGVEENDSKIWIIEETEYVC